MDENEFEEILTYLSTNKYPEYITSRDTRSNWRKKCRSFTCFKENLYYNHKKYGALVVVKGVKEKQTIIENNHQQEDGKHHGINKTMKKISTQYYWKTIAKDVHNFIKNECQTCTEQVQRYLEVDKTERENRTRTKTKDKIVDKAIEQIGLDMIGNILEPSSPSPQEPIPKALKWEPASSQGSKRQPMVLRELIMSHCGLDVVGPLSETHRGHRFIVVLTDSNTKWVEATAVSEFTTELVGNFIVEMVYRHGVIEEITTKHMHNDFGTRLSEKINASLGITIQVSSFSAPPQANDYHEYWYNSLLCSALIKYSSQNQYYWDNHLQKVILAYRTFHQKNTLGSPFLLLYNRPIRLPVPRVLQSSGECLAHEQEELANHINNIIKALASPTNQQPFESQRESNERLTPQFINSDPLQTNAPPLTPSLPSSQPTNHHNLGPFTPVQASNQMQSTLPLTTVGTSMQHSTPNAATIFTIPNNGITAQTISATPALSSNGLSTQGIRTNSIAVPGIQASHTLPSNTHVITTPTAIAGQVVSPQSSIVNTTTVHTPSNMTSQVTAEAPSGHMVMIHTDGKAYDSFYVLCPQ